MGFLSNIVDKASSFIKGDKPNDMKEVNVNDGAKLDLVNDPNDPDSHIGNLKAKRGGHVDISLLNLNA